MKRIAYFLLVLLVSVACKQQKTINPIENFEEEVYEEGQKLKKDTLPSKPTKSEKDTVFTNRGLIDVTSLDTTIAVCLKYNTTDNFTGKILNPDITKAWLRPESAQMLLQAQRNLKELHPELALVVYDATRPFHIQHEMWNLVKGTEMRYYVANPLKGGGLHNYGMAVDVTLLDAGGKSLPMGSLYDSAGKNSHITDEDGLLATGKITHAEFNNRRLLRQVMREAGFRTVTREWWHFNACSLLEAQQKYPLIP